MNSACKSNSRLPVASRASTTNSAPRRSRSSVACRSSLKVPRSKSSTPCSIPASRSPLPKKDNRPLSNKKWQKEQAARVLSFIQKCEPGITCIKPLSIALFGKIMYYLLKTIDCSMQINEQNISTELPMILKAYDYPTKLQPSVLKWPNTEQAFPAVLGVMVYCLDIIEMFDDCFIINDPDPEKKKYKEIFRTNVEDEGISNIIKKQMIGPTKAELCWRQEMMSNIENLERENAEQNKSLKRKEDERSMVRKQLAALEGPNMEYKEKLRNIEAKYTEIDSAIKQMRQMQEKFENETELIEKFDASYPNFNAEFAGKTLADFETMLHEYEHTISLQKERLEQNMQKINELDFDLVAKKSEVEKLVYSVNNTLTDLKRVNQSWPLPTLPEIGFGHESYLENIIQPSEFNDILNRRKKESERAEVERRREVADYEEQKMSLNVQYLNKEVDFNKHLKLKENVQKKFDELERVRNELTADVHELKVPKIDLQEEYSLIKMVEERKKRLSEAEVKSKAEMRLVSERVKDISCTITNGLQDVLQDIRKIKNIHDELREQVEKSYEKMKKMNKEGCI